MNWSKYTECVPTGAQNLHNGILISKLIEENQPLKTENLKAKYKT